MVYLQRAARLSQPGKTKGVGREDCLVLLQNGLDRTFACVEECKADEPYLPSTATANVNYITSVNIKKVALICC